MYYIRSIFSVYFRDEGESEFTKLNSDATAADGMCFIELRKIKTSRENDSTLAKTPNMNFLPD